MPFTQPPLDVLPDTRPLIGDDRTGTTGGEHEHVYAATGRPTTVVPLAGEKEMDQAVAAARAALPGWRETPPTERRALLLRLCELITANADELVALQVVENSVPIQFAASFPAACVDFLRYAAGWADRLGGDVVPAGRAFDFTLDEPYGVVAVIVPWNGPLVSVGQVLGPALVTGNTVVLKPPELAPFTSLRLGELFRAAGFPPGVVNVVPAGPEGGDALVRHPGLDKIHFTGSGATARRIVAAAGDNLTPACLELGGKSAHLIFADADLRLAARQALTGMVVYSGQGCANGTRILVEQPVYEEVLTIATKRLRHVRMGDPFAPEVSMGPLVTTAACDRVLGMVSAARERGDGRLVTGGERADGDGFFVTPTVFADVDNTSDLAQLEIFGPVLCFLPFRTEEEAVRLANDTPYGLAGYLNTNDLRRAHRVSRRLECGSVWVNGFQGLSPAAPFGGTKGSGYGRTGGAAGIREFTRPKNVWLAL
jgi:aldehyde dehydrogenase (NAD+)